MKVIHVGKLDDPELLRNLKELVEKVQARTYGITHKGMQRMLYEMDLDDPSGPPLFPEEDLVHAP